MTLTTDLRLLVAADVGGVVGLVKLHPAPLSLELVEPPAAYLWPLQGNEGETDGSVTIGGTQGEAVQKWAMRMYTRDVADPDTEAETFLDRVRNAIEDPASGIMGHANVQDASVSDWRTEFKGGEDTGLFWVVGTYIISATYWYARGSL